MNETRHTAPGPDGGETFESTQALFQRWRESRPRGAQIPKALWAAAVEMAREVGVAQMVQHLHVDGPRLLKRMEGTRPAPVPDPHSVPLWHCRDLCPRPGQERLSVSWSFRMRMGGDDAGELAGPGAYPAGPAVRGVLGARFRQSRAANLNLPPL